MFAINEKVVYPGHGVATVDRLIDKRVACASTMFYELVFVNKDMTILVPVSNSATIGVRKLSSVADIAQIFAIIGEPASERNFTTACASSWNKRSKNYQCKIRSGDLFEIAKIYRDLHHIATKKELSFGERNLLQQTEALLAEEISLVYTIDTESAIEKLRQALI